MHPCALILHPFFHEAFMFLLPYMDFNVGSWCKFYTTRLKSSQGTRHVHAPGKQRFRTQWSLPLCVFTCDYLRIPSCNPQAYPAKLHSILILKWCDKNPGYLPVLADVIYFFDHLLFPHDVYCLWFCPLPIFPLLKMHKNTFGKLCSPFCFACVCVSWMWI